MSLPETMQAVITEDFGTPSVLNVVQVPTPTLGPDDVLVKVHATAVNTLDTFRRSGLAPIAHDAPHIAGCDAAGEIVVVGEAVERWQVGNRVAVSWDALGDDRDGTHAEYVAVAQARLQSLPETIDYTTAACAGMPFAMAWIGLHGFAAITADDQVVIHAGGGCLSAAVIQVAAHAGAQVIAIADAEQHAQLQQLGATVVLDQQLDLPDAIQLATDGRGASLVVDVLGKDTMVDALDWIADEGRIVCLDTLSGDFAALDIRALIDKRVQLIGASGSLRADEHEAILTQFVNGSLRPMIEAVLPLSADAEAHRRLEAEQGWGQFILVPDALYSRPGKIRVEIE